MNSVVQLRRAPRIPAKLHTGLWIPASLGYRPLAISLVSALVDQVETADRVFRDAVVTAFSEAFNNIVIHAYRDRSDGSVKLEAEVAADSVTLRLMDYGSRVNFGHNVPEPAELPERGMGIFMIHALVDKVTYVSGEPNVLTLVKKTVESPSAPDSQLSRRTEPT